MALHLVWAKSQDLLEIILCLGQKYKKKGILYEWCIIRIVNSNMIDYIFYRVYWAYNKKRESAKFLSPLYMAMVFAFLFFPFALFLCELLRDSYHRNDGYLLSIYLLMILIYSYLRFFPNKKIWLINKKFEGNGYNYKIPDWCFFVVLPLSIVWGIITYSLLVKFFIKPFALRGIIYNML